MKQSLEEDNAHCGGRCQGHRAIVPTGAVLSPSNLVSFEPHNYPVSTLTIIPFPDESGGLAGGGGSSGGEWLLGSDPLISLPRPHPCFSLQ